MRRLLSLSAWPLLLLGAILPAQTNPATKPTIDLTPPQTVPATDAEKAAQLINDYLEDHKQELQPKLDAAKYQRFGSAAEVDKLKPLLPADLAARLDLAKPVLVQMMARGRDALIGLNLKTIGEAISQYIAQKNALPTRLGELAGLTPAISTFVLPETLIPEDIALAAKPEQAAWVDAHAAYLLLSPGADRKKLADAAPIAMERPDLNPKKPQLAVLFLDGHVEMMDRAKAEKLKPTP
ncbi:MAG TPA: hypothetical protein VHM90_06380 [Phycisphaerae bacterium]|nr:hypothetical protein [Phycisphaerae bacterium]